MSASKRNRVHAFLQARMSSQRLPGKVLTPVAGKPLFLHVFESVSQVVDTTMITVITSSDPSDDPLCEELSLRKISFFRGDLDNVLSRFSAASDRTNSDWIMRISCDSPLLSPEVLRMVLDAVDDEFELITNVFPRTFPKGQSVEILRRSLLSKLRAMPVLASHREHVTLYVYENPTLFRIKNVVNPLGDRSDQCDAVDTADDLAKMIRRMEK